MLAVPNGGIVGAQSGDWNWLEEALTGRLPASERATKGSTGEELFVSILYGQLMMNRPSLSDWPTAGRLAGRLVRSLAWSSLARLLFLLQLNMVTPKRRRRTATNVRGDDFQAAKLRSSKLRGISPLGRRESSSASAEMRANGVPATSASQSRARERERGNFANFAIPP